MFRHSARLAGGIKVAESRKQLDRALAATPELEPIAVTIFGGALEPESWRFPFDRLPAFDDRDWDAIQDWAEDLGEMLCPPQRRQQRGR